MAALSLLTEGSLCGFSFAVQPAATIRMTKVNSFIGEPDNVQVIPDAGDVVIVGAGTIAKLSAETSKVQLQCGLGSTSCYMRS